MGSDPIKLLVVDDEVDLCQSIASYFEIFGYETKMAFGGEEAIKKISEEKFNLIITDIRMPKVDGVQVLQSIKARDMHKPKVYVISGYADLPLEDLYDKGADGFFSKPFDSRGMLEAIRKATIPLAELWKRPPSVEPENELLFSGDLNSNSIKFGRGGFSVVHPTSSWDVDDLIKFQLNIGDIAPMELRGAGIVRWRKQSKVAGQVITGIEITFLEDDCRNQVVDWLSSNAVVPFIPLI